MKKIPFHFTQRLVKNSCTLIHTWVVNKFLLPKFFMAFCFARILRRCCLRKRWRIFRDEQVSKLNQTTWHNYLLIRNRCCAVNLTMMKRKSIFNRFHSDFAEMIGKKKKIGLNALLETVKKVLCYLSDFFKEIYDNDDI